MGLYKAELSTITLNLKEWKGRPSKYIFIIDKLKNVDEQVKERISSLSGIKGCARRTVISYTVGVNKVIKKSEPIRKLI